MLTCYPFELARTRMQVVQSLEVHFMRPILLAHFFILPVRHQFHQDSEACGTAACLKDSHYKVDCSITYSYLDKSISKMFIYVLS
ncbi:hypothetical protein M0R45_037272 [Rubus argutus]|uniref:Uncharacterized protein n=1 Tax=Rubus argutus TaxID=59490 RepID=A0AAW1W143_RUBAR